MLSVYPLKSLVSHTMNLQKTICPGCCLQRKNTAKSKTWYGFRHRNIWGGPPFHCPTSKILLFVLHLNFVKILFKSHKTISYCWGQIYLPFMKSTFLLKRIVPTWKFMGNILSIHLQIFFIFSCDYVVILFPKYLSPSCEFLHQI